MKKQLLLAVIVLPLIFSNCRNTSGSSEKNEDSVQNNKTFYPIGNFIRSELAYMDSMPLAIIKYITVQNTTDSSIMDKSSFKAIAEDFMTPDISSPELKAAYDETSFIDATIGTITLAYTANTAETEIKRADILLNQETGRVKTIYVEKVFPGKDSTVIEKMLWTARRNCQVTILVQKDHQPESVRVERYVWDNQE